MALSALSRTNDEQYNKEIEKRKTKIAQRKRFCTIFFFPVKSRFRNAGFFGFQRGSKKRRMA